MDVSFISIFNLSTLSYFTSGMAGSAKLYQSLCLVSGLSATDRMPMYEMTRINVYIAYIYSGENDKCSALVTRNNSITLLDGNIVIKLSIRDL